MKRALVLSGGGARGAFQVGMLEELVRNQKLDFDIIRGVSVGALNGAVLAQVPVDEHSQRNLSNMVQQLHKLWTKDIKGNPSVYSTRGGWIGVVAGADSLYSFEPLKNLIKKYVNFDQLKKSKRNFKVGTVSLVQGTYQEWDAKSAGFFNKLVASASIPAVFPFVDLKQKKDILVDGGVRNITPLKSAFKATPNPEEIYVLLASKVDKPKDPKTVVPPSAAEVHTYPQWDDNWLGTKINAMDVLERTIDLLTDEIYLEDIKTAVKWNQVAAAIENLKTTAVDQPPAGNKLDDAIVRVTQAIDKVKRRSVKIHVLAPTRWFDPGEDPGKKNSSINFSPRLIKQAIEHGKEIARDRSKWLYSSQD